MQKHLCFYNFLLDLLTVAGLPQGQIGSNICATQLYKSFESNRPNFHKTSIPSLFTQPPSFCFPVSKSHQCSKAVLDRFGTKHAASSCIQAVRDGHRLRRPAGGPATGRPAWDEARPALAMLSGHPGRAAEKRKLHPLRGDRQSKSSPKTTPFPYD